MKIQRRHIQIETLFYKAQVLHIDTEYLADEWRHVPHFFFLHRQHWTLHKFLHPSELQ